jgi:hypothetical protein
MILSGNAVKVAVEQSLGRSQSLSVSYVGSIGRDLLRAADLVGTNPNLSVVSVTDNSATSDYHALQIKFQPSMSQDLQALASYTLSRSIGIASPMHSPTTSTRRARLPIRTSTGATRTLTSAIPLTAGVTYALLSLGAARIAHAARTPFRHSSDGPWNATEISSWP